MPIARENILAHEWIGLHVTIKDSSDPRVKGLSGLVRDETRNMFLIESEGRIVKVLKPSTVFVATLPTREEVTVDGSLLNHRPEDRVKKGLSKW